MVLGMTEMTKNLCKDFAAKVVWQDWIVVEARHYAYIKQR